MEKIIYTSPTGDSIEMSARSEYILTELDGMAGVDLNIQSSKSFKQDGENYQGNNLEPRYINVSIVLSAENKVEMDRKRNKIIGVLNPKLGLGKLEYHNGGEKRVIEALPERSPDFINEGWKRTRGQRALATFYCPNPYWVDKNTRSKEIVSWVGGLTFPLELPTEFSTKGEEQINVINNGDAETPVVIDIKGKATNPCIRNLTTGEYIKVNREMVEEDSLRITTEFGNKRVEQNGENVFNYIDLNSTLFSLKTGDNIIQMTTDDVNDAASVRISYKNRYLGV